MCCVKYRLTGGDHYRSPYKKDLESVTILGLPVSVCSEHRFRPDSCHVAKGKAVGWSRYVPVFPPLFPVAAPADHLQVVAGVVRPKKSPSAGFRASMPVHASSTSRLGKSRLNTAKKHSRRRTSHQRYQRNANTCYPCRCVHILLPAGLYSDPDEFLGLYYLRPDVHDTQTPSERHNV